MSKQQISQEQREGGIPYLFRQLRESGMGIALWGTPKNPKQIRSTKTLILGAVEQSYGIYQVPTFESQVNCLWNDPLVKEAITMFAEQVVATGFFLTGNPDYKVKLGPNHQTALGIIQEWCKKNHIDNKLLEIAIELKAFGNSFWKIDDFGFSKIPIESAWHMVRVEPDRSLQEVYDLQVTPLYGSKVIPYNEFIHFRVGITGYHAPMGQGVIYSLLAKPVDSAGHVCPSVYDVRLNMRRSLDQGFTNFSFGNVWIGVPNMSNEDFDAKDANGLTLSQKVAGMSPNGNRVITNTDIKVELEVPERTQSYDEFIKNERDEFFMSLADPSLKLGLEQGFTKATSVTASEVYQFKISNMRRTMKQEFEDIFEQLLTKLGFDAEQADIQMNFGPEETAEYAIADLFQAQAQNIISKKGCLTVLVKYHKWDFKVDQEIAQIKKEMQEAVDFAVLNAPPTGVGGEQKTPKLSQALSAEVKDVKGAETQSESEAETKVATESNIMPKVVITELHEGVAAYNQDMSELYVDPLVPDKYYALIMADKVYEYSLLDQGAGMEKAHFAATNYSRSLSKELNIDWTSYNEDLIALQAQIKARNSKGPENLYKIGAS